MPNIQVVKGQNSAINDCAPGDFPKRRIWSDIFYWKNKRQCGVGAERNPTEFLSLAALSMFCRPGLATLHHGLTGQRGLGLLPHRLRSGHFTLEAAWKLIFTPCRKTFCHMPNGQFKHRRLQAAILSGQYSRAEIFRHPTPH